MGTAHHHPEAHRIIQWSWLVVFGPTLILLSIAAIGIALVAFAALAKGK